MIQGEEGVGEGKETQQEGKEKTAEGFPGGSVVKNPPAKQETEV